jgi:hypothetical protein
MHDTFRLPWQEELSRRQQRCHVFALVLVLALVGYSKVVVDRVVVGTEMEVVGAGGTGNQCYTQAEGTLHWGVGRGRYLVIVGHIRFLVCHSC